MRPLRLAIVSTHPIQYYAPLFRQLAASSEVRPRVFFTWSQSANGAVHDPGFGRSISWDIPLLDGYESEFVPNVARRPGTGHFHGLRNPSLVRAIQSWQPDALLVFGWNFQSHLQTLRYFKGRVPVFFRGDSTLLNNRGGLNTRLRRRVLRWVYRHIDVAIAVGSNNRDYYKWCGVPELCIAYAPHAIDTARFSDAAGTHELEAQRQLQALGITANAPVLLFAGKFIAEKDCVLLLDAFIRSQSMGHLVLVGNGPFEEELRARAVQQRNVHFLPFQNQRNMPSIYRLGDVYVLPSRSETWGLALNEAMASGRPILASDAVGGARDLINSGNGWIFQSGDVQRLIAVLRHVLSTDRRDLRRMGEAASRDSVRWSIEAAAMGIQRAVIDFVRLRAP